MRLQPFMAQFAAKYPTMPLVVAEVGTNLPSGASPTTRAQWIAAAQALFTQSAYARFIGIAYYDADIPTGCEWVLDAAGGGDTPSQNAWQTLQSDPYYQLPGLVT